jgi:fructoselysine-6-P-deglycase FrlB-like protein
MTPADSRALMQRELDDQPTLLPAIGQALLEGAAAMRPDPDRPLWVGGCGDSLFAAQAIAHHARALGRDIRPASAAEMLWDVPIRAGDTVIGISLSGSTRRTVEALTSAADRGARTIAITLDADSALARAAAATLVLPYAPVSRAIPHGLDYHVTLLALAALLGEVDGATVGTLFADRTVPILGEVRRTAASLSPEARVFFLGGGAALGSANYGAAKLHEAGGLTAFSFEAENFAHGANFVPRPGDHVVLCGAAGPADARTEAMAGPLSRLGVSIGRAGLEPGLPPLHAAFAAGLHAQALCLAIAEARDLDVTDPGRGSPAAEVQRELFGWQAG